MILSCALHSVRPCCKRQDAMHVSRRQLLQAASVGAACLSATSTSDGQIFRRQSPPGWVTGNMTGADALVETLRAEGCDCVFGIPGAQENELWDSLKSKRVPY